jgi:hypothetical protein
MAKIDRCDVYLCVVSGGITPFMHPESMTAIVEVRVIEGMTMEGVHEELRSALVRAGLADRWRSSPPILRTTGCHRAPRPGPAS